jgi:hypothetical protein
MRRDEAFPGRRRRLAGPFAATLETPNLWIIPGYPALTVLLTLSLAKCLATIFVYYNTGI